MVRVSDCSIIIPSLGHAAVLDTAIRSALEQTRPAFEIIVLAMDEESRRVASAFPIQIISHLPVPVGVARNTLIAESACSTILPLDADDILHPDYLLKTYPLIEEDKADVVSTFISPFGSRKVSHEELNGCITLEGLLTANRLQYCSVYRKQCWQKVGGYWNHPCYADWALWVKFARAGFRFARINEYLFNYRMEGAGSLNVECSANHDFWWARVREA